MKANIYYNQKKEDGFIGIIELKERNWNKWCESCYSEEFDTSETEEANSISIYHLTMYLKYTYDDCGL